MRRTWVGVAVSVALVLGVAVGAGAESIRKSLEVEYSGIQVKVNGKVVESGASQPFIVLEEGRTYVPARYLAEALGGKVSWDDATKTVVVNTARYVETVTEGDQTTFRLPYYGAGIKLPSFFQNQPADKTNLLNLTSGPVVVVVNRTEVPAGIPFDTMISANLQTLKSIGATITSSKAVTPIANAVAAQEVVGTMAGGAAKFRMHLISEGSALWVVMVSHDARVQVEAAQITGYLNGFALSK